MDQAAQSIPEFCRAHGISRATYYNLNPEDRPREMRVLTRVLISREASAEWRQRMERKREGEPEETAA